MGRIHSLQVLRFVAAAMVVHAHGVSLAWALGLGTGTLGHGRLEGVGVAGVDIFFVLSGVVICRLAFLGPRRPSPAAFLRRRIERLVPLYWLVTLAGGLTIVMAQPARYWREVLTSLTFWPAWDRLASPVFTIGWTLCFEALFYVGAALVLRSWRWAGVLAVAYAVSWWLRVTTGLAVFRFLGNPLILEFLFGVAVALVWRERRAPKLGLALVAFGVGALVAVPYWRELYAYERSFDGSLAAQRVLLFGVPAALIVCGALHLEPRGAPSRVVRGLALLGDASYALYLTHWLLAQALVAATPFGTADGVIVGFMALSILVSLAVWIWLEKPFLAALRRPPTASLAPAQ